MAGSGRFSGAMVRASKHRLETQCGMRLPTGPRVRETTGLPSHVARQSADIAGGSTFDVCSNMAVNSDLPLHCRADAVA